MNKKQQRIYRLKERLKNPNHVPAQKWNVDTRKWDKTK